MQVHNNSNVISCAACGCNTTGSLHGFCNPVSGQCECLENVVGRDCSLCDQGFREVQDLQCVSCRCDPIGECLSHVIAAQCLLGLLSK